VTDIRVDVAVVGAGLMGSATAWELTRRGVSVALLEQFEPGHAHGSSHGTERIVRRAYADPFYTRLTARAMDAWAQAEDDTGTNLLRTTGGLDTGVARDPAGLAALLAAEGVACDLLARRRRRPAGPACGSTGRCCSTRRPASSTPTRP
jgi:glycine/D-amino acid oxidase-like deaminating enzyme